MLLDSGSTLRSARNDVALIINQSRSPDAAQQNIYLQEPCPLKVRQEERNKQGIGQVNEKRTHQRNDNKRQV